ncbi:MAG: hypothetical protein ACRCT5_13255 [Tannerellaceae bacterium]
MNLKLKQDSSETAIVEVRIDRGDERFFEIPYELLTKVNIHFEDAEEIDAIMYIGSEKRLKKRFWLSVNKNRAVYLSNEEPQRTSNGFVYKKDSTVQVPDGFLECGTKVWLAPMETPLLFKY